MLTIQSRKSTILSDNSLEPKPTKSAIVRVGNSSTRVGEITQSDMNTAIGIGIGIVVLGAIATVYLYKNVGWVPAAIAGLATVAAATKIPPAIA